MIVWMLYLDQCGFLPSIEKKWELAGIVQEEDKVKTAFTTSEIRFWHFSTMSFGLCNAPATFKRLMEHILSRLNR